MSKTRTETDSFGPLEVPVDKYWGAQTQRSLGNFKIGGETMPLPLVRALGIVKYSAARANISFDNIDGKLAEAIAAALDDSRVHTAGLWEVDALNRTVVRITESATAAREYLAANAGKAAQR